MIKLVNKLLLAGDKLIHEMQLRQPGFTYSACKPFRRKERIKKKKKQEIHDIFIRTYLV